MIEANGPEAFFGFQALMAAADEPDLATLEREHVGLIRGITAFDRTPVLVNVCFRPMNSLLRALLLPALTLSANAAMVDELKATAHDGQVFLTWREAETPSGTTFKVYVASSPIEVVVGGGVQVGHHIERHSARDWWEVGSPGTELEFAL